MYLFSCYPCQIVLRITNKEEIVRNGIRLIFSLHIVFPSTIILEILDMTMNQHNLVPFLTMAENISVVRT